jgi:L-2-hydroxyglutarate oxidase LhgO
VDNGVKDLQAWSAQQVAEREPALQAIAALWSPSTGIVDSHAFMQVLSAQIEQAGGLLACGTVFQRAELSGPGFQIEVISQGEPFRFSAAAVINSAGLHAGSVAARITGMPRQAIPVVHYCKGVYFAWQGKAPFQHLIYPVADANSTGLGIHATLDLAGQVRFGPDTQYVDELDYAVDLTRRPDFVAAIARYFPAVQTERLTPAYAGIRPKLQAPGAAFADFRIDTARQHGIPGLVNLFGFESPGLTAALALAADWQTLLGDEFLA